MHVVHHSRGLDRTPPLKDARRFHTRLVAGSVMETEGYMSYFAAEWGVEVTRILPDGTHPLSLRDLRSSLSLLRLFSAASAVRRANARVRSDGHQALTEARA